MRTYRHTPSVIHILATMWSIFDWKPFWDRHPRVWVFRDWRDKEKMYHQILTLHPIKYLSGNITSKCLLGMFFCNGSVPFCNGIVRLLFEDGNVHHHNSDLWESRLQIPHAEPRKLTKQNLGECFDVMGLHQFHQNISRNWFWFCIDKVQWYIYILYICRKVSKLSTFTPFRLLITCPRFSCLLLALSPPNHLPPVFDQNFHLEWRNRVILACPRDCS